MKRCETLGLKTIPGISKEKEWEVHMIEQQLGAYTDCAHEDSWAAIAVPYNRHICHYGLDKFVRFAQKVWQVDSNGKEKMQVALAEIDKLSEFIKELSLPTTLRELGATEEMLPLIANSSVVLDGGYKKLTADEILDILKKAF